MKKTTIAIIALVTIALLAGAAAVARVHGSHFETMAARCDTDTDGRITPAEFEACGHGFDALDRDQDGALTEADFGPGRFAGMGRPGPPLLGLADADRDHAITAEEWNALVTRVDADADGAVTRSEVHDLMLEARPEGAPGPLGERPRRPRAAFDAEDGPAHTVEELRTLFGELDRDGDQVIRGDELDDVHERFHKGRHGRPGFGPGPGPDPERHLDRLDTDDDGQVSAEEWATHFEELDADGDGQLEAEELPGRKGRRVHHGRHHGHGRR